MYDVVMVTDIILYMYIHKHYTSAIVAVMSSSSNSMLSKTDMLYR